MCGSGCLQCRLRHPCFRPIEGRGGKGSLVPAARLRAPVLLHLPSLPSPGTQFPSIEMPGHCGLPSHGPGAARRTQCLGTSARSCSEPGQVCSASHARGRGRGPTASGGHRHPYKGVLGRPKGHRLRRMRLQHDVSAEVEKIPVCKMDLIMENQVEVWFAPGRGVFSF